MSGPNLADDIRALEEALAAGPTPGDWAVGGTCTDDDGAPETVIRGMDGRAAVAVTLDFGANNPLMREANALLIAAANPERMQRVLGTLKQLQQERDELQRHNDNLRQYDRFQADPAQVPKTRDEFHQLLGAFRWSGGGEATAQLRSRLDAIFTEWLQLREQAARYHWLCAHLTQIHVETSQPAGSPEDTPMRVTLIQAWPDLPGTEPESVDEAVKVAMQEGL
jgi:hypothetical protein